MKAAVLEIRSGKAAVLMDDGTVRLIPDLGFKPGDVIDRKDLIPSEKSRFGRVINRVSAFAARHQSVAALFFVTALTLAGFGIYSVPCTSVDIDINPSVEYRLNVFDRVVSSHAFNDDGAAITEGMALKGKNINTAMRMTLDSLRDNGYIGEDTTVVYTVSSPLPKNTSVSRNVADTMSKWSDEQGEAVSVSPVAVEVPKEVRKEAKEKNVSPGKLTLVKELQNSTGALPINEDEWLKKPVAEIMKAKESPAPAAVTTAPASVSEEKPAQQEEKPAETPKPSKKKPKKKKAEEKKAAEETLAQNETVSAGNEEAGVTSGGNEAAEVPAAAEEPAATEETAVPASPAPGGDTPETPAVPPVIQPVIPVEPPVVPAEPEIPSETPEQPEDPGSQQPAVTPQTQDATQQQGTSGTSTSGSSDTSSVQNSSTERSGSGSEPEAGPDSSEISSVQDEQ